MNVKLSEIARRTGLSLRYWQGRAARGALPGAKVVDLSPGTRRYLVDSTAFDAWWGRESVKCYQWIAWKFNGLGDPSARNARHARAARRAKMGTVP